jgi:hypothetical protein
MIDIIPPPELVEQWYDACILDGAITYDEYKFAAIAAQWGADQELEACLRLVEIDAGEDAYDFARYIRSARRPKPPSLKKQALELLPDIRGEDVLHLCPLQVDKIRRALEALPDG